MGWFIKVFFVTERMESTRFIHQHIYVVLRQDVADWSTCFSYVDVLGNSQDWEIKSTTTFSRMRTRSWRWIKWTRSFRHWMVLVRQCRKCLLWVPSSCFLSVRFWRTSVSSVRSVCVCVFRSRNKNSNPLITLGTGAKPAFEYLYPLRINHSSGRKVPSKTTPEDLLLDLLEIVRTYRHQYQHHHHQQQQQLHGSHVLWNSIEFQHISVFVTWGSLLRLLSKTPCLWRMP